eukprot:tig00021290_g19983.t1
MEHERAHKRARSDSASAAAAAAAASSASSDVSASSAGAEPRLDALPDELLVHIVRSIGLRDVLLCRPYQVCRRLRRVLRTVVWDELDLAPPKAKIQALEAMDDDAARAQFSAEHMQRLNRVLASLHPEAGFAAWGSARALRMRLRLSSYSQYLIEEAYAAIEIVSSLARASPSIETARVEFRCATRAETEEFSSVIHTKFDASYPRIAALLTAFGVMPNLTRLELGRDLTQNGWFFAWKDFICNEDGITDAALALFTSLQHLSLPYPVGAEYIRTLLRALPALRSISVGVPVDHLRRAAHLFFGHPQLDRIDLSIKWQGASHEEGEFTADTVSSSVYVESLEAFKPSQALSALHRWSASFVSMLATSPRGAS